MGQYDRWLLRVSAVYLIRDPGKSPEAWRTRQSWFLGQTEITLGCGCLSY